MERAVNFIMENWEFIISLIVILLGITQKGIHTINEMIAELMIFAEKKAVEGLAKQGLTTGEEKKAFVVDYVYNKVPSSLHFIISKKYIGKKIEYLIADIRNLQDDGKLNVK